MFILGSPNFLRMADLGRDSSERIAENIGRSLYMIPGMQAVSFSQSQESGGEAIMKYDLVSGKRRRIATMLEGNGFYAWTPAGSLIMGVGEKLYALRPGVDPDWQPIGDLAAFGIKNISRLTVGPHMHWLAVVSSR
jgi:hypothetical protein